MTSPSMTRPDVSFRVTGDAGEITARQALGAKAILTPPCVSH
jgi:hypothetical protein